MSNDAGLRIPLCVPIKSEVIAGLSLRKIWPFTRMSVIRRGDLEL